MYVGTLLTILIETLNDILFLSALSSKKGSRNYSYTFNLFLNEKSEIILHFQDKLMWNVLKLASRYKL